jgi:hypothetical protein
MIGFGFPAVWEALRPHVSPVDPTAGSQGAARGPTDGRMDTSNGVGHTIQDYAAGLAQEGIMGMFDMQGMLDRQDAQRDLASRFNIIPAGTPGTREQNQVTEAEFQEIARTYSDIRLGRGDLTLGDTSAMSPTDATAFRENAMPDVADILQSESGRGLIGSLANAPLQADGSRRPTTIDPRLDASNVLDPSNAEGGGVPGESGYATYAAGMDALPGRDNLRSDVALYHELTHAHHAVYDTWDDDTVGEINILGHTFMNPFNPDSGVNGGEHQAAGLGVHANDPFSENRYRGERRRIGELNVGERTTGFESDDNMTHRDQYNLPTNSDGTTRHRTNPAYIPR